MAKFYRSEDKTVLLEAFGAGSSIENLKSLKANTTDAAVEKHLPVVTQEGNKITVAVSSVEDLHRKSLVEGVKDQKCGKKQDAAG